jgi:hypothetical protein
MIMPKKDTTEENKESYDFKAEHSKTIEEQIDEKMREWEKQDEPDDLHILDIAKNPPEPGYMKTELKKAVLHALDEDGEPLDIDALALPLQKEEKPEKTPPRDDPTVYVNCEGDKLQVYDTIFDIDLAQMAEAQVSDCASTIFPMLIDETVALAVEEKKIRTLEKRKNEFQYWWVILLVLMIVALVGITFTVLPGIMGG